MRVGEQFILVRDLGEGSLLLAGHFRTNHLKLSASEGDVAKQNTIINVHPIAYVFLSLTSEKKTLFYFFISKQILEKDISIERNF